MEPDRYQQNHKLYITGFVCLIISMAFFGVGAYIIPRVVFGLNYNIPEFIFNRIYWIHTAYEVSEKSAGWLVLLIFFSCGFFFTLVTYISSNHIDHEIYPVETEVVEEKKHGMKLRETRSLVLKIMLGVGLVFIVAEFIFRAVSST